MILSSFFVTVELSPRTIHSYTISEQSAGLNVLLFIQRAENACVLDENTSPRTTPFRKKHLWQIKLVIFTCVPSLHRGDMVAMRARDGSTADSSPPGVGSPGLEARSSHL